MKMINIQIEQGDDEPNEEYEMDCITTINGRYYHDCLQGIYTVLANYDSKKKLTKSEKKILEDIRVRSAPFFKGVIHE